MASSADIAPGRYAAIDVGTNSTLLLVADVSAEGGLQPLVERAQITRLGRGFYAGGMLRRTPRQRTLDIVREYIALARRRGAEWTAIVGTEVLRQARNGPAFCEQVRHACGVPIEIISGVQEAELTHQGILHDPALHLGDEPLACVDLGGGSTEIIQGCGEALLARSSYPIGAVRLTEECLPGDPPTAWELLEAERLIESILGELAPLPPETTLAGAGGTILNLASVALDAGLLSGGQVAGACLQHTVVTELVDLFSSLPNRFRKRIPGLEPERADIILGGALILHQLMARLSAPRLLVSTAGVRHGCIYALARRVPSLR